MDSVVANDSDIDGDTLNAVLVDEPSNGSLMLNTDGSFTYTPNPAFEGTDSFTYQATDGLELSNPATVTIVVSDIQANPDSYSLDEDTTLTVAAINGVLANDLDVENDPLSASLVESTTKGTLNLRADGSFTYVPNANFNGSDRFTYAASDADGSMAIAEVTLVVNPINDAPVANDDNVTTTEDSPITINVLSNDLDVDGDSLSVSLISDPSNGSLNSEGEGIFTYTPADDFSGTDSFTYQIDDGNGTSDTATVNILVTEVIESLSIADLLISEGEDTATFTVTLNSPSSNPVIVDYATADGTAEAGLDYESAMGSLTFDPGETEKTIEVTILDDALFEEDENFFVTLDTPEGAAIADNQGKATIEDNEGIYDLQANFRIFGEVNRFSFLGFGDLDLRFGVNPEGGFVPGSLIGSIEYVPGYGNPITSGVFEDVPLRNFGFGVVDVEFSIPFSLKKDQLGSLFIGLGANESGFISSGSKQVIFDFSDELAFVGSPLRFTPGQGLTLTSVTLADGTPLADAGLELQILPENTTLTAGVSAVDAAGVFFQTVSTKPPQVARRSLTKAVAKATADEVVNLQVNPEPDPLVFDLGGATIRGSNNIRLTERESLEITINDVIVAEEEGTATFTVSLSEASSEDVTAEFTTANGTATANQDYEPTSGTIIIPAGVTEETITVNILEDKRAEANETFSLTLNNIVGATISRDNGITVVKRVIGTGTIIDNDNAPIATNDSYNLAEDTSLVVSAENGLLINDSDGDGDTLTAALVSNPAHASVTVNADGSFTYIPNANFEGNDSFTYVANDGINNSNVATVNLSVEPGNDAPEAMDDSYQTQVNQMLIIDDTSGVLLNDIDIDGDTLTVELITQPTEGSLILNANGSFEYTPNLDFSGSDSFTYQATDGLANSNTAIATLFVSDITAVEDQYQVDEDEELIVSAAEGVLSNDFDLTNDALTASLLTAPSHGELVLETDGSFNYSPDSNFNGTDSFVYEVTDDNSGTATATATITINPVNDDPVANDDTKITPEDNRVTINVLSNDIDVDGDTLTIVAVEQPANGAVITNANNTLTYVPQANFNGEETFNYTISDPDGRTDSAIVTVVVTPVNDRPTAIDDIGITEEDVPIILNVLANDSDLDGDNLTTAGLDEPTNGNLTLNSDSSFTYISHPNFNGTDSFTYIVSDGNGGIDIGMVNLTINVVEDAPIAVNDAYSVDQDNILTVDSAEGVLANDSDGEGDSLTVVAVSDDVDNGTLTLNPDGSFSYTPNMGFKGIDSFIYEVSDGKAIDSAMVIIDVGGVNNVPVAVNDAYSSDEDTILTISAPGLLSNDTDLDGDSLSVTLDTDVNNGILTLNSDGSFEYSPNTNFNGTDSFTYIVSDGKGGTNIGIVDLTINAVNDAPVAVDDAYSTDEDNILTVDAADGVLANDSDIDGDSLNVTLDTDVSNGILTLNSDGSFSYTPNMGFNGLDSFIYELTDGNGGIDSATVIIDVGGVNDAPVAVDDAYSTDEDTILTISAPGLLSNDTDVDGDSLSVTLGTDVNNGVLILNGNGSFNYIPNTNFNGTDSFTYIVSDGNGGTDTGTVNLTINAVNDLPVAVDDNYSVDEDNTLTVDAANGVLANDTDEDGDNLRVVTVSDDVDNGTLTLNPDGSFEYTPNIDFNGTDSFTYTVNDGNGETDEGTVTINVSRIATLDIDGNDILELQDYNLIDLYAAQLDEEEFDFLLNNFDNDLMGEDATRTDADSILTYLNEVGDSLFDIDGNGIVELQDYNLIDLYAAQLDQAELGFLLDNYANDLRGKDATRIDVVSILAHFETIVP